MVAQQIACLHEHEELDVEDLEEGRVELGSEVIRSAGRPTSLIGGRIFPGLPIADLS